MAKDLHFLDILLAENPGCCSKGVNLMLKVDNRGDPVVSRVRFFASDGGPWQEIFSQEKEFAANCHIHAYFHLPASCFAPAQWGGQWPEELSLYAGETPPEPNSPAVLLFLEP